jgi:hypothetical protein
MLLLLLLCMALRLCILHRRLLVVCAGGSNGSSTGVWPQLKTMVTLRQLREPFSCIVLRMLRSLLMLLMLWLQPRLRLLRLISTGAS